MASRRLQAFLDDFRRGVAALPRPAKRALFLCFDLLALTCIVWLSFAVGLNGVFVPDPYQALLLAAAPLVTVPVFVRLGLYRSVLRYLPDRTVWTIARAVTLAVLAWVSLAFLSGIAWDREEVPRSVPLLFWILAITVTAASRFGAKWLLWGEVFARDRRPKLLIYGTGEPAVQLAGALKATGTRQIAGFVSDDPGMLGMDLVGSRVFPPSEIERLVVNLGIGELVLSAPQVADHRTLVSRLGHLPVRIRMLPAMADLASGKYRLSDVRDIDIDDLLRRSQVSADAALMRGTTEGRAILVTGAAGSIGSALSRIVARLNPAVLVLMDINEYGLYELGRELAKEGTVAIRLVLGSVTDPALVDRVLGENGVDTVYHCAAYKHVSLVEENCLEGVRNNVFGTLVVAEAAAAAGVRNFILISSDKAVRPANVMGATKRWSELIVRHVGASLARQDSAANFACVRFGNVIGSSGSVVPLFREQIAAGGPVTLTHPGMTRYFMSVREAAELIVQAGGLSASGDVMVLEMGDPVRILDLAQDMIMLAGLTTRSPANPGGEVEIAVIGPRPGEKLHEELFYDPAGVVATRHPKIMTAKSANARRRDVPAMIARIRSEIEAGDEAGVRRVLFEAIASPPADQVERSRVARVA